MPRGWIADPDRRAGAGVPERLGFSTKPELARVMLARALADGAPAGWARRLSIRRNLRTGELAFYRCAGPATLPLAALARVAGCRWRVEMVFPQLTKGRVRAVG